MLDDAAITATVPSRLPTYTLPPLNTALVGELPTPAIVFVELTDNVITVTLLSVVFVTYAVALSALTAIDDGPLPTTIVCVVTVFVAVLIFVTLFDPVLTTNSRVPSGVNANALGVVPALILATDEYVEVSMTFT